MRVLFLGDIVGRLARNKVIEQLPRLRDELTLDFIVINCENAAGGFGITPKICEGLFAAGADVLTTGNHVWDKKEIIDYIAGEPRLLRPLNMVEGTPGNGILRVTNASGLKLVAINIMTNLFMAPNDPAFTALNDALVRNKLGRDADFILVDVHGEATSEKMALGHYADGRASLVVGTHTHIPTADLRILPGGTAYQTDVGMCGDYRSVIGMNRDNSLKKFLKDSSAKKHYPALGEATISGLMVTADTKTGLAKKVEPIIVGKYLENRI